MARFIRLKRALSADEALSLEQARRAVLRFEAAARVKAEVFAGFQACVGAPPGLVVRLRLGSKSASRLCWSSPEVEAWLKGALLGVEAAKLVRRDRLDLALESPPVGLEGKDVEAWKRGARAGFSLFRRACLATGGSEPSLFDGS